ARPAGRAAPTRVTAGGDKLLGGPQAGLLLGREPVVTRLARHPLARALPVGKLSLAALEARVAGPAAAVQQALATDPASFLIRVENIVAGLSGAGIDARTARTQGAVGGGGAPG